VARLVAVTGGAEEDGPFSEGLLLHINPLLLDRQHLDNSGIQGLGPIGKGDQRSGFSVGTKVEDPRLISRVTRSDIEHKGKTVCQLIEVDQLGVGCCSRSDKSPWQPLYIRLSRSKLTFFFEYLRI